jgi:fibronectin-binding autotransporter adhesin
VPQNGDTLVFSASLSPTGQCVNNLIGLSFASISFSGNGSAMYYLFGAPITLTGSISDTHSGTGTNTVALNIVQNGVLTVNVQTGTSTLTLSSAISGNGGLTKMGGGHLRLAGTNANTYAGVTTVNDGYLDLAKTVGTAVPSGLVVGDGVGEDYVRYYQSDQVEGNVTLRNSGHLLLYSTVSSTYSDTIGSLTMQGGSVNTGHGTLTLGGSVTISTAYAVIDGYLNLGNATRTFTVADVAANADLQIDAQISGGPAAPQVAIRKMGSGELYLANNNTFGGEVVVDEGQLTVVENNALGATSGGTTVNGNAVLLLGGDVTGIGAERLTLNSTYPGGALIAYTISPASYSGDIELRIPVVINTITNLTLFGAISGAGGFTKIGSASLGLFGTSANTYSGVTRVHEGVLALFKVDSLVAPTAARIAVPGALAVGDGVGTDTVGLGFNAQIQPSAQVTLMSSALLDLNGHNQTIGPLTMTGGRITNFATGTLTLGSDVTAASVFGGNTYPIAEIFGRVSLNNANRIFTVADGPQWNDFVLRGEVMTGGLTKQGLGNMVLAAYNSYAGTTYVNAGSLSVWNDNSMGSVAAGTIVASGAQVEVFASTGTVTVGEPLTLSGPGDWDALRLWGQTIWSGNVTLSTDTGIDCPSSLAPATISGAIQGPGGLIKWGYGDLRLAGGSANTYRGTTYLHEGKLLLAKSLANACIPGPLIAGDYFTTAGGGGVVLENDHQLGDAIPVILNARGWLDIGRFTDHFGSLAGEGSVRGVAGGTVGFGGDNTSTEFNGAISGPINVRKAAGSGTTTLWRDNTYTGSTFVDSGTLIINGRQPQSAVTVSSGAALGGYGTVGAITSAGNLQPSGHPLGHSPTTSLLTCSNLSFSGTGRYDVDLDRLELFRYDRIEAFGAVNLGGAALRVSPAFTKAVQVGDTFIIICNDGSDPVVGTFAGLPNGSQLRAGNYTFQINYNGFDGNDVVLSVAGLPFAAVGLTVPAGNGDQYIGPNECNLLGITLTNRTETPIIGAWALLVSLSPEIVVNQAYSEYPLVPVAGTATNTRSFQVSTLPGFVGYGPMELVVYSSSHGKIIVPVDLHTDPSANPPKPGEGVCQNCVEPIHGLMNLALHTNTLYSRLYEGNGEVETTCAGEAILASVYDLREGSAYCNTHTFVNAGPATCVSLRLQVLQYAGGGLMASAYLHAFDPTRLLDNLLNYASVGGAQPVNTCSFFVPAGAQFVVVVNVLAPSVVSGWASLEEEARDSNRTSKGLEDYEYVLQVHGLPCPTPMMEVALTGKPAEFSLSWPTWAGEHKLESSPSLTAPVWTPVITAPVIDGGYFYLTNPATGPSHFFRFKN